MESSWLNPLAPGTAPLKVNVQPANNTTTPNILKALVCFMNLPFPQGAVVRCTIYAGRLKIRRGFGEDSVRGKLRTRRTGEWCIRTLFIGYPTLAGRPPGGKG